MSKLFDSRRVIAALPDDCKQIDRRTWRIRIYREADQAYDRILLATLRVRLPEVFPKDNDYRQGAVLSGARLRVQAWLQHGVIDPDCVAVLA